MLLGTIKESYREVVLDLALYIAEADNEFSESEKSVIDAYRQEMGLSYQPQKKELKTILDSLSPADSNEKRKILFEMAALVIADGSYSDEEEKLVKEISSAFNISDDFITQSIEIIDDLNVLYLKASKLVTG
jgi:tellurite resistance protein